MENEPNQIAGKSNRMDTTVVSDSINLTSRLEIPTKTYGASIIISEDSLKMISNIEKYHCRKLDCVIVKGKSEAMGLSEINYSSDVEMSASKIRSLDNFLKHCYYI